MVNDIDFQAFWDAYALKRDRIAAERAWKKLSVKDRRAAMAGIVAYREDCERRGISRMYAQGYLNHHRWEDELETDNSQRSIFNSQLQNVPLSNTTAVMAESRKAEVRELSRIATAGAAALAGLVGGGEDE